MRQIISTKYIKKTRKSFLCDICEQHIPAGGSKRAITVVDRREIYTWKECEPCQKIADEYFIEYPSEEITASAAEEFATERWGSLEEAKIAVMSEVPDNA